MKRQCEKCKFINKMASGGEDERCPMCSALYARAAPNPVSSQQPAPAAVRHTTPINETTSNDGGAKGVDQKYCADCGAIISRRAEICPKCGVRQMSAPFGVQVQQAIGPRGGQHSRMVAALLALFLGGIGIHKFYLGKGLQGVLYLVFCWTFIPALIAFVEAIKYLMMSDEAFAQQYG